MTTADDLRRLYAAELADPDPESSAGRIRPKIRRSMVKLAEAAERGGELAAGADGRTWIWSDLHLHHTNIIRYCGRPFDGSDAMNAALLEAWRTAVGPAETIICGGDIALSGRLKDERLDAVRAMPGRKIIVAGNHDMMRRGRTAETGCEQVFATLLLHGDPRLLVTHVPVETVPAGCVNVHGHVHNERLRPGPYINVCVEHTGYAPLRLADVRTLARRRLADPRPNGETTADEIRRA